MSVSHALNAHEKQDAVIIKEVWFEGTTALLEGQAVCYNFDYGTAASKDGRRAARVEVPSVTNARWFAGVAACPYAAKSTGQMIRIYCPGSVCNILSRASTTLGTGRLTFEVTGTVATNGSFRLAGFPGEGSAVPLQTIDRSSTAGLCQAKLEVGEPSGGVQDVTPAAAGGAIVCMVGGVTYFTTAVTLAADATFTLADGTIPGLKKAFVCQAAMTTNDIVITVTSGIQGNSNADPTTALATISLDADLEEVTLQWDAFDTSGVWVPVHKVGATFA
jgi:hypothetical protein